MSWRGIVATIAFFSPFRRTPVDFTQDRDDIPKLDEPELIQSGEVRITKYVAPLVGVITVALAAVTSTTGLGLPAKFTDLPAEAQGPVGLGILLVVASVIASVAGVSAADIRARGHATAANLALRARPPLMVSPPGAPGTSLGLRVNRQGFDSTLKWTVITTREATGTTEFLLARAGDEPAWVAQSQLSGWELGSS